MKRPYDTLQPTQRWKRRKQARAAVAEVLLQVGCPLDAIQPPPTPSPAELIHLPTSTREAIRSVPSLHIPCEQSMINCKRQLATSHATETGTFAGGAFITDPVRFVSVLCAQSSFVVIPIVPSMHVAKTVTSAHAAACLCLVFSLQQTQ
jgi:hypothetical protein